MSSVSRDDATTQRREGPHAETQSRGGSQSGDFVKLKLEIEGKRKVEIEVKVEMLDGYEPKEILDFAIIAVGQEAIDYFLEVT